MFNRAAARFIATGRYATGRRSAPLAAAGGNETVLLVEDEDSVRQLVRETLESRGYRVLEAANGNAALEFDTEGMYRGTITEDGTIAIAIYRK